MRPKYCALLIITAVVVLTPLAYATPPDPSWIRGLYDGGDFDDVVVFVTSGVGAIEPFPLDDVHSLGIAIAHILQGENQSPPAPVVSSNPPRAPPLFMLA
jgi:hypothetical protein